MKNLEIKKQTKHVNLKFKFYPRRFIALSIVIVIALIIYKVVF